MKNLLKNWIKAVLVVCGVSGFGYAEVRLDAHLGEWEFKVPFATNLDAIGAYDVLNEKGLVGGESVFAAYKGFEGTLGILTDSDITDGDVQGTLAIGARKQVPQWGLHVGMFIGRDFRDNVWRGGVKFTKGIFGSK